MPELDYKQFNQYVKTLLNQKASPVYLFYGEEFLFKTALEALLDGIFTASHRRQNYDAFDDTSETIYDILERINTYSLLSGPKVVVLRDSKIFYSGLQTSDFFEKAKAAYDARDIKKASGFLLNLISTLKLTYEDLADPAGRSERLKYDPAVFGDDAWVGKIIDYSMDKRLAIPPALDNAALLQRAIEKGFPQENHLVITTDIIDKRRALYKCILTHGTVVDCSVPKGDRRADRTAQEAVLADQMRTFLERSGKSIRKDAYDRLIEMTGFDLRTFADNLEKLVSYVGDRTEICIDDVDGLLKRTKKDPIYELTNAIAERSGSQAVYFLDSLLSDNFHPLQILAAVTNQVRRLLVFRDFMESPHGGSWQGPRTSFSRFREAVLPAMQAYDRELLNRLGEWEGMASCAEADAPEKPVKRKDKTPTDLSTVKNPQNPFPVFQTLQKAQGFELQELLAAVEMLSEADLQMKSTVKNPRLILEKVILTICRGNPKGNSDHAGAAGSSDGR